MSDHSRETPSDRSVSSSSTSYSPTHDKQPDAALLANKRVRALLDRGYVDLTQVHLLRENPALLDRLLDSGLPLHAEQITKLSDPEACLAAALEAFEHKDVIALLELGKIRSDYVLENFTDPNFYLIIKREINKSTIHTSSFSIDDDNDNDDDDDVDDKKNRRKAPIRRKRYTHSAATGGDSGNSSYPYATDSSNPRVIQLLEAGFLRHDQIPLLRGNEALLKTLLPPETSEVQAPLPEALKGQIHLLSNPENYFEATLSAFEDNGVASLLRRKIITSEYVLLYLSDFNFYNEIEKLTAQHAVTPSNGAFGGGVIDTFTTTASAPAEKPLGNTGLSFVAAPRRGVGNYGNFGPAPAFNTAKKSSGPNSRVTSFNFESDDAQGISRGNLAATTAFATIRGRSRTPSVSHDQFAITADDLMHTSYLVGSATNSPRAQATSSPRTSTTISASLPPPSNINRNQQPHATTAANYFYQYANSSGAAKRKAWRLAITEWLLHTNDRKNTQYIAEKAPSGDSYINASYFQFIQNNPAATTSMLHGYAALLALLNYFLANQAKPVLKQSYPWDQNKRLDDFIELLLKLQTTQTQEQLQNYLTTTGKEKGFVAKSIPIPVVGQGLSYFRPPTQEYQDLRLDLAECVKSGSTTSQDLTTAAKLLLKAIRTFANTDNKSLEHWLIDRHASTIELVLPSYQF